MATALSVLIATYNGASTVGRTLAHLSQARDSGLDWEVIVVDNGSTDDTVTVARSFENRLPLRVLTCAARGKNRALNHGLKHVQGEVVVLTDDDILPERDWLCAIRARADRHDEVDLFGGLIVPTWEAPPPPWLSEAVPFGPVFGVTPQNLPDGSVDPGRLWGGNMFVRRRVFDRGLRFDEGRGPGAGNYVMGGDTEFAVRAAAAGYSAWWCPDVRVRHIVRSGQLRRNWLLRRAYLHGKSMYAETAGNGAARAGEGRLGFPRFLIRQAVEAAVRAASCDLLRDQAGALRHWWRFCHLCGAMAQARAARARNG